MNPEEENLNEFRFVNDSYVGSICSHDNFDIFEGKLQSQWTNLLSAVITSTFLTTIHHAEYKLQIQSQMMKKNLLKYLMTLCHCIYHEVPFTEVDVLLGSC
jgi:hypothetical protein